MYSTLEFFFVLSLLKILFSIFQKNSIFDRSKSLWKVKCTVRLIESTEYYFVNLSTYWLSKSVQIWLSKWNFLCHKSLHSFWNFFDNFNFWTPLFKSLPIFGKSSAVEFKILVILLITVDFCRKPCFSGPRQVVRRKVNIH